MKMHGILWVLKDLLGSLERRFYLIGLWKKLKSFYDKGLFDNFDNADEAQKVYLFIENKERSRPT